MGKRAKQRKKQDKKYTDEYKRTAVEVADRLGVLAASIELDVPRRTLYRWCKQIKAEKRYRSGDALSQLAEKLFQIADLSADRLITVLKFKKRKDNDKPLFNLRELSTVLGTATDKLVALRISGTDELPREFNVQITVHNDEDSKAKLEDSESG